MTAPVVATAVKIQPVLVGRILVLAASGIAGLLDIQSIQGRFVTIQNSGTDAIGWLAGDANVVVDLTATTGDTRCAVLEGGTTDGFAFPDGLTDVAGKLVTHIAIISTGAPLFRAWQS